MEKAGKKKVRHMECGGGCTVVEIIITNCVTKQTTVTAFHVHIHSFSSTWCAAVAEEETTNNRAFCSLWRVMWRVRCVVFFCTDAVFFFGLWTEHIAAQIRFLFFLPYHAEAGERKAHSASSLRLYLDVSIRMSDQPLCEFFGGLFTVQWT